MSQIKTAKFSIVLILIILLLSVFLLDNPVASIAKAHLKGSLTEAPFYTGSDSCGLCHEEQFHQWRESLHSKMYKKKKDAIIHADFSKTNEIDFTLEDVDWVIGSRWKQEFVQIKDGKAYVYPAIWLVEAKKWKLKNNKEKLIAGEKCDGCHTTGFDFETKEFSEDSIGCEACHGPGSRHVVSKKKEDIFSSPQVDVCSQCHTRGMSLDGKSPFPIGYKLGEPIESYFVTRKTWDGKVPIKHRQHHDEFTKSKHYKALSNLKNGKAHPSIPHSGQPQKDGCLRCHSHEGRMRTEGLNLNSAKYGLTCVTCHNPHRSLYSKEEAAKIAGICGGCHVNNLRKYGPKKDRHYPCPEGSISCPDCHMPKIKYVAEKFDMRDHSFSIVTSKKASENHIPSSCTSDNCHINKTLEEMQQQYIMWYGT